MTLEPLISLVMVVRDEPADVARAVAALELQRYRNFELVVQYCAEDRNALEALGAVEARRVDIAAAKAASVVEAHNRAFERCEGALLAVLDPDEWLDDTALQTFVRWFQEHRNAAFCYGATRLEPEGDIEPPIIRSGRFDFVRLLLSEFIPPVAAGCFNRTIIGTDLAYHEPAGTASELDLFLRLGLRFDRTEIVEKADVVRNQRSSTDDRLDPTGSHQRELQDHAFVLHRFFVTHGNSRLNQHLHRVSLGRAYSRRASMLFDRGAPMQEIVRCLSEAARQEPGSEFVSALAGRLRGVSVDPQTGQVLLDNGMQPVDPPESAEMVEGAVVLADARTKSYWPGASAHAKGTGARVQTGPESWSYAALLPFRIPDSVAEHDWLWAELLLDVREGQIGVGILDASNDFHGERLLNAGSASVILPCRRSDRAVLIRNGANPGPSTVDVLEVHVRRVPIAADGLPQIAPTGS